ncbi:hypothetical protein HOL34_03065 [bacterium]|jgi:hypothetical protein|nr:hypothetical protein [bacterium]MBT3903290.1 hypothetical protein [bacterium]MBT4577489.1 hypothetical protein [bacterium]MBT5345795.1 hypothetical protein [bacterium]MBT6130864.1 hypothetical protein [bacterium]
MNIKRILGLLLAVITVYSAQTQASRFTHVDLLYTEKIDGLIIPIGVANMRKIIGVLTVSLFGKSSKSNPRPVGKYSYQGQLYTLEQLAHIEADLGFNDELDAVRSKIIDDFMEISQPFKEDIHAFKSIVLRIIDEWVIAQNLESSIIAEWCLVTMEEEVDYFRRRLSTMGELYQFVYDVTWFLRNFVGNCTGAVQNYFVTINRPDLYEKFITYIRS